MASLRQRSSLRPRSCPRARYRGLRRTPCRWRWCTAARRGAPTARRRSPPSCDRVRGRSASGSSAQGRRTRSPGQRSIQPHCTCSQEGERTSTRHGETCNRPLTPSDPGCTTADPSSGCASVRTSRVRTRGSTCSPATRSGGPDRLAHRSPTTGTRSYPSPGAAGDGTCTSRTARVSPWTGTPEPRCSVSTPTGCPQRWSLPSGPVASASADRTPKRTGPGSKRPGCATRTGTGSTSLATSSPRAAGVRRGRQPRVGHRRPRVGHRSPCRPRRASSSGMKVGRSAPPEFSAAPIRGPSSGS